LFTRQYENTNPYEDDWSCDECGAIMHVIDPRELWFCCFEKHNVYMSLTRVDGVLYACKVIKEPSTRLEILMGD